MKLLFQHYYIQAIFEDLKAVIKNLAIDGHFLTLIKY